MMKKLKSSSLLWAVYCLLAHGQTWLVGNNPTHNTSEQSGGTMKTFCLTLAVFVLVILFVFGSVAGELAQAGVL